MSRRGEEQRITSLAFYGVVLLVGYLAYRIVQPFLVEIGWAVVLAICLAPLRSRLAARLGPTRAALALTVLSLFLLNAGMAFVMSEHAVAAMTFPITVEIAQVLRLDRRRSNYARALFLALAWGTSIGGIATLLGGGRAPLAIGMLRETSGQSYTFLEWSIAAWPIATAI